MATSENTYKHQRRLINLMLQPVVQLRIGMVQVVLSLAFVLCLGIYVYSRFVHFVEVVTTLTEADSEVAALLSDYLRGVGFTSGILAVAFVAVSLGATVYMTHKLIGPTVAFRRHIKSLMEGNFTVKTRLRDGDAFTEVADDLNRLSDRLIEMLRR